MTYKEHVTKSNHKIRIWDNLLTQQELSKLMNFVFKMPFNFNLGYDGVMFDQQSKICCKCLITSDWMKRNNLLPSNHIGNITFKEFAPLFSLNNDSFNILNEFLKDRVMLRAWVNAGTTSDRHILHVDSNHPDALVLLQYINLVWDKNWDGYTLFRSQDANDIEHVVDFVPGRLVLFDGEIPHKSTPQTYDAPTFRFTANSMWIKEEDYFKQVKQ